MSRPFNPLYILEVIPRILPFLYVTAYIALGTVIGGSLLGALLVKARLSHRKAVRAAAESYLYIVRSTPSIVMLFLVFYGVPQLLQLLLGINTTRVHKAVFVLTTFIFLFSASMSEIMRSAYLAVDKGQREAGLSIGLSEFQTLRRIIFPQAVISAIPNFANSLVSLIKEGALAYTVGLIDIMGQGTLIIGKNYGAYAVETYLALAVIYWTITVLIEKGFGLIEARGLSKKHAYAVKRG